MLDPSLCSKNNESTRLHFSSLSPKDEALSVYLLYKVLHRKRFGKGKIWLEYSDVVCHVVLLYSVDWSKACISFIFLMVNLFRNCTLTKCEV